jgi:hypothetical protein
MSSAILCVQNDGHCQTLRIPVPNYVNKTGLLGMYTAKLYEIRHGCRISKFVALRSEFVALVCIDRGTILTENGGTGQL